jgi:hypothetical protein
VVDDIVPNSPAQQQRLSALARHGQVGLLRHCLTVGLEFHGETDPAVLQSALDRTMRRHPALRARFPAGATHHVIERDRRITLLRKLIPGADADARRHDATAFAFADRMRPFDVHHGPLMRATLLTHARDRHLLVLSFDQLVIDAWSAGMVVQELVHEAHSGTAEPAGAEGEDDYPAIRARRIDLLNSEAGRSAIRRRHERLADAAAAVPVAREPGSTDPDDLVSQTIGLPDEVVRAVRHRTEAVRVTPFAVAMTALALAVGQGDGALLIRSTFACREEEDEERAVGWLSNELSLRLPPPTAGTVREHLRSVHTELIAALTDQWIPSPDDGGDQPGMVVSMLYLPAALSGAAQTELRVGDCRVRRTAVSVCPSGADVDLLVVERPLMASGETPELALGGTARSARVGGAQLSWLLSRWAAAYSTLSAIDWDSDSMARAQLPERIPS